MIIFVDTLAGVKYPEVIQKIPRRIGTGYFYEEFGLAKKQIEADLKSGRVFTRVQGLWAGKSHDYTDAHAKRAKEIGVELQKIAKRLKFKFFYSPFCEHKRDAKYMSKLFTELKVLCPDLYLVNSPIRGGDWVDSVINEIHNNDKPNGMPKGEYIYSMDGLHQPDCNIEIYKKRHLKNKNCIAFGAWALQHNCKINSKDTTPALKRNCKPTQELNESLLFQIENDKGKTKLEAGWISKSHSEQHKDIDPRANKLVVVGPKGKKQKQVSIAGVPLRDGGLTEDKRNTWRSARAGFKFKSPATIVADGKVVGVVDPGWRENEWKEKT